MVPIFAKEAVRNKRPTLTNDSDVVQQELDRFAHAEMHVQQEFADARLHETTKGVQFQEEKRIKLARKKRRAVPDPSLENDIDQLKVVTQLADLLPHVEESAATPIQKAPYQLDLVRFSDSREIEN